METFFIEYRDPLFGIIVFFLLLFVISFMSYWWGRYKTARSHRDLTSFLGSFEDLIDASSMASQLKNNSLSHESWLFLASAFEHQGSFEQSTEIYRALLSKNSDPLFQKEVLLLLGKTYFKAGFLERSRITFIQILQNHPRTPAALQHLVLVYEQLQQFDKALEAMESLLELQPQSQPIQTYLQCRLILCDTTLSVDEKCSRLSEIYTHSHTLGYLIFEYLFTHRPMLAWSLFDRSLDQRLSDILWRLSEAHLDLDIISHNAYLQELFTAKGFIDLAQTSTYFELDILIGLRKCGSKKALLQFEYSCSHCKHISFFPFHRCPQCHSIDTISPIMILSKEYGEENNSLQ